MTRCQFKRLIPKKIDHFTNGQLFFVFIKESSFLEQSRIKYLLAIMMTLGWGGKRRLRWRQFVDKFQFFLKFRRFSRSSSQRHDFEQSKGEMLREQLLSYLESILPTHWCKEQMRRHTEFGVKDAVQFHQQSCAQIYQYTQLEVTANFYTLRYMPCAKRSV